MTPTIIFATAARAQMGRYISEHPDRAPEFAAALRELTRELAADPAWAGESRGPFDRILVVKPLTVLFRPAPGDGAVYVVDVRLHPGRD